MIDFLVLIAGRKQKDALLTELSRSGARLVNSVYGRGTVNAGYFKNTFGFVHEENKAVITCLLPDEKTDAVLRMLVERFNFNRPNTGVAFTVPIGKLSF